MRLYGSGIILSSSGTLLYCSLRTFRITVLTATIKTVYFTPSKFTSCLTVVIDRCNCNHAIVKLHKRSNNSGITDEEKRLKVIIELVPTLDFGEVEQHLRQNKTWETFSTVLHQMGHLVCLWVFKCA